MADRIAPSAWHGGIAVALTVSLGACSSFDENLIYGGGAPRPPVDAGASAQPDARGIIAQGASQAAVAQEGDTVASLAARIGIPAEDLARLNGLPVDYRLRPGEVLALPEGAGLGAPGEITTSPLGWSPEIAAAAIDGAPGVTPADNPFANGQTEPLIDPIRHRVEPGETAYSIARLYGVSVTALASWNGLGPDLAVRENQELLIPIVSGANQITSSSETLPGEGTPVAAPPSAAAPLPQNIETDTALASPGLGQYRTPPGGRLAAPVEGPVTKQYNPGSGPNSSEGIGFSVPAGTPVRAAGDGEVALVSESIGGLGTIVLIRHADDLMTVYGRVDGVTVSRGQPVSAGQTIGVVAERDDPELHFEVRRGTESVDPTPYLGG
jgi:lipoprotein NlpD